MDRIVPLMVLFWPLTGRDFPPTAMEFPPAVSTFPVDRILTPLKGFPFR